MKRLFDVVVASVALVVVSPLMAVLALLVRVRLGRPVLFRQDRVRRGGAAFAMAKFRTMTSACGPDGAPLADEERLTPLGRRLRSSSLDELPELWHVVRGEMSLVGPRPLPVRYLHRYTEREARRHDVRPGLTGWAQINGRNTTTWEERLEMDVWYVEHRSFLLDLRVLFRTVAIVVRREGISTDAGGGTMPELRGPGN